VVGVPVDEKEAALSEDGALEVEKETFSIEPFLFVEAEGRRPPRRLVTWRDVRASQELLEGDLPIPSVRWEADGVRPQRARLRRAAGRSRSSRATASRTAADGRAQARSSSRCGRSR
jgi:hypothetical protein